MWGFACTTEPDATKRQEDYCKRTPEYRGAEGKSCCDSCVWLRCTGAEGAACMTLCGVYAWSKATPGTCISKHRDFLYKV